VVSKKLNAVVWTTAMQNKRGEVQNHIQTVFCVGHSTASGTYDCNWTPNDLRQLYTHNWNLAQISCCFPTLEWECPHFHVDHI
jgi:hypothetical protein